MAPESQLESQQQAQIAALVTVQGNSQAALTGFAVSAAGASAKAFTDWYSSAAIGQYASQLAALVESIQSQSASGTDAYLAEVLSAMKGSHVSPAGTIDVTGLRKGVSHTEVYGRSADVYRYQRSLGKTEDQAQEMAVQRAEVMAETDVQLAQQSQSQKFMMVKKVSGYRRVIHPELSTGGTCGLCIAAATRFYSRGDLMPLHARCKCTVAPIINSIDPGNSINKADLKDLYAQAGNSTARDKLKAVRYTVHSDGEIGPVLAPHGQAWRSPTDVRADAA